MKKTRMLKKTLSLLLCVLMVFSTISMAVTAAPAKEVVSKISIYGANHTHIYGNWEIIKPATCQNEGVKERHCTVAGCTAKYTKTIAVAENAHLYGAWITTTEATCEANGVMTATCQEEGCGYVATRSIQKLPHTLPEKYLADGSLNPEWKISKEPVHGAGLVTQIGYVRASCAICGATATEEYFDAENWHVEGEEVSVIRESTCSTPGAGMKTCTVCGDTLSFEIPVDKSKHVFTTLPYVDEPSTCVKEGVGHNQCSECKEIVTVAVPVDPEVHVDKDGNVLEWKVTKEAYHHSDGLEVVNCYHHGEVSKKIYADHELSDDKFIIKAYATCVKAGVKYAECKNCHRTIEKEIPINESHDWVDAEVLCVATCSQEGIQVKRCSRHYAHVLYETTEFAEHTFVSEWKVEIEADCNTAGTETNECVECAKIISRTIPVIPDAHKFVDASGKAHEWKREKEPTCYEPGLMTNYCYECKKTIEKEIPKHSNTLREISRKEASCKYEGEIFKECQLCSEDVYEAIPIDPNAHNYRGLPAVEVAPTCQKNGVGLTVCAYCSKECRTVLEKDPDTHVDADGNILEWKTVKPISGCENGIAKLDCAFCGTKTKTLYSKHGMVDELFNIYIYPSCEGGGVFKSKYQCPDCEPCSGCKKCPDCNPCAECGDYEKCTGYVYIPIEKGHVGVLLSVVRKATCTQDGLALYNCARGKHLYYEIIPATGHTAAEEFEITSVPTCESEGKRQLYCADCGEAIQPPETIAKSHVYTSWIIDEDKAATCSKKGTRYRFCQNCNYYEESDYMLSHTPGEWEFPEGYNCTTGGVLKRYCKNAGCERKLLGTMTVAAGTHGATTTINVPASVEYCLSTKVVCNICKETISAVNKEHKVVVIDGYKGWEPTCEEYGMTDATLCMVCGYQTEQRPIPALGHNYKYNENGNKVCVNCGDYRVENQNPDSDGGYIGCKCFCHDKGMIAKILYKVCVFFWKLLGINKQCDCGQVHWDELAE